jgi:hypothetical protein
MSSSPMPCSGRRRESRERHAPPRDWTIGQTLKIFAASATANDLILSDYSVAHARGLSGVTV